jgi:hypothetical protein
MGRLARKSIDALDAAGFGLRAIFTSNKDCFDHNIVAVHGESETPLLFAADLPLQEVVDHRTFDGRQALLATGSGSGQYWSVSVDATVDLRLATLGFDIACRESIPSPTPEVRYLLANDVAREEHVLVIKDGRQFAVICDVMPVSIATEFIPTCCLEASAGRISLQSNRAPHVSTPNMARWRYEFRFVRPI